MQEIKCPNCGAPAKNHKNCEFCGSLLVRFANKGIDLTNTTYLNNDAVLPGLIKELEKNLELQTKDKAVCTDIYYEKGGSAELTSSCCIITSSGLMSTNGDLVFPNAEIPSLGVSFRFQIYNPELESKYPFLKCERDWKESFEKLTSISLFDLKVTRTREEGGGPEYMAYEYAIDFGQDAEGAARLISEIHNKVFGCELHKPLIYSTNTGKEIDETRNKMMGYETPVEDVVHTDETSSGWDKIKKWIWFVIVAIGILLSLFL